MKVKISDVIAKFLGEYTKAVFVVSGGANLHILDSLARNNVKYVCTQTEQSAGFAADAMARLTGAGCALATSGPGATNLITAIASSYYDSVPCLYLTGQQSRSRLDTQGCRQIGFQQTPIVPMVSHITKYAVTVMEPEDIIYEFQKALHIANEGRPGPVVVDIPDDLQRLEIDPSTLRYFKPECSDSQWVEMQSIASDVLMDLHWVKRPLIIYGWGVRLARAEIVAKSFADMLGIPIAATWAVRDVFPEALCFGTHGTKAGNLAVQNADYILSIGSRLDTKATSSPVSLFAPNAKLVMVDIDPHELAKMGRYERPLYRAIPAECKTFLGCIESRADMTIQHEGSWPDWSEWREKIAKWKVDYPTLDSVPPYCYRAPYSVIEELGDMLTGDEIIVSDTGNTLGWMMQAFKFKGQRFLHPFNNTPMGYGLPGALAAGLATGKRVVVTTGDGSIMMAIGELATIAMHKLDVKVILFNNNGHSMCRYTQKQWLGGKFAGTGLDDLAFPRFGMTALAAGWDVRNSIADCLEDEGPCLVEIPIDPNAGLAYQVRFGKALEDGDMNQPMKEAA